MPQLLLATHSGERHRLRIAFTRPTESRVVLQRLIDGLAGQVGQPRLNIPRRNAHQDSVCRARRFDTELDARLMQLCPAHLNAVGIAIDDNNETGINSATPQSGELAGKILNDILDRRTRTSRQRHALDLVILPTHLREEPRRERLLLLVFTEQNNLGPTPHTSQPRAISSE